VQDQALKSPSHLRSPETSDPDAVPFTTTYYFPGTDTPRSDHILIVPIEMVHYTDTTSIHIGITTASQAPIGTSLSSNVTPTLPLGYRALNASIPTPTQTPSGTLGGPSYLGTLLPVSFRHFLNPLLEELSHPPPATLILVALFRRSHQITKFLLVDNFTKEV
jgi:hypothetical protein